MVNISILGTARRAPTVEIWIFGCRNMYSYSYRKKIENPLRFARGQAKKRINFRIGFLRFGGNGVIRY
jgi:hypothetical protein